MIGSHRAYRGIETTLEEETRLQDLENVNSLQRGTNDHRCLIYFPSEKEEKKELEGGRYT